MTVIAAPAAWRAAVDGVVEELLSRVAIGQPPIDALAIAERLRVEVAVDASQPGRGRFLRLPGRPAIFLRPEERPERRQWAVAHELGEMSIERLLDRAGVEAADVSPEQREELANLFAARLLLPERFFRRRALDSDGDLVVLKRMFATASYELIAFRLLDLDAPSLVSVFDHGRLTRRRSNVAGGTPPLQPVERRAQGDAHLLGLPVDLRCGPLRVQAWPIHEAGWKREIVRTTIDGDDAV